MEKPSPLIDGGLGAVDGLKEISSPNDQRRQCPRMLVSGNERPCRPVLSFVHSLSSARPCARPCRSSTLFRRYNIGFCLRKNLCCRTAEFEYKTQVGQ